MREKNVFLFIVATIILLSLILFTNIGYADVEFNNYTNSYSQQKSLVSFKQNSDSINNVNIINSQEATLDDITFSELGEIQTFTIPVINTSLDTTSKLEASVTNSNTEYFDVTCQTSKTILNEKSDEAIIEVKVQLIKIPINSDETAEITINIVAEPIY